MLAWSANIAEGCWTNAPVRSAAAAATASTEGLAVVVAPVIEEFQNNPP